MILQTLREAAVSGRSQPIASVVTVLMVMGMILAVMLTTGRTVGAEEQVLGSIDSSGTRSITIKAETGAGLSTDVLTRIQNITGIEWAGAFSSPTDATNAAVPDGTRVPVRFVYTNQLEHLDVPSLSPVAGGLAYASPKALEQFGLSDRTGAITLTTGETLSVAGEISTPDYLSAFEPLALVPQPGGAATPISVLIVIAKTPELVAPVSAAVLSVLDAEPGSVKIQTSEELAKLRGLVQGQLGSFSRGLILALLALTGTLVAVLLYGLVMMRRKDFGRRRALGATRSLIVALLLLQTGMLTILGIGFGVLVATVILLASGDPLPGLPFTVALAILTLATTLVAALAPALVASRREPIRELRVP